MSEKTVYTVSPGGFCSGVRGALEIFQEARGARKETIFVLNELVHNSRVRQNMIAQGAVFVKSPDEVPDGSTILFGAHGVGKEVENKALEKSLDIIDACCPRVKKLHREAAAVLPENALVIFGNPDHPEVKGVAGHARTKHVYIVRSIEDIASLPAVLPHPLLLCQTTRDHLEIEAFTQKLKTLYPDLTANGGVCNAVFRRQQAVEKVIPFVDAVIIVGSPHSSNANRMRDVARRMGKAAFLVDSATELPDLAPYARLGLGAGASTPDEAVGEVLKYLQTQGYLQKQLPSEHGEVSQVEDR